jgi:antiviral helicase SKI2
MKFFRAFYTSPIKALSNQKYCDFKKRFNDVGLLTGDVQINHEASCLIMTTEILRYRFNQIFHILNYFLFKDLCFIIDQIHLNLSNGLLWMKFIT